MYRLYVLENIPGKVRGIGRREVRHQDFETMEEAKKELARIKAELTKGSKRQLDKRNQDYYVANGYRANVGGYYLELKYKA